jgi:hypothetical protein
LSANESGAIFPGRTGFCNFSWLKRKVNTEIAEKEMWNVKYELMLIYINEY